MSLKMRIFWKVRAMPARVMRCGNIRSIRLPKNSMAPAPGVNKPVIRLNTVVLPAPLGPIKTKNTVLGNG